MSVSKVLQLTHRLPIPPNDGGKIGIYNFTKQYVENGYDVDIVSIARLDERELDQTELDELTTIKKIFFKDVRNKVVPLLLNTLFSKVPYNMNKYRFDDVWFEIKCLIENNSYEFVHLDHLHMAYYGKKIKECFPKLPVFIREHNVEYMILSRLAFNEENLIKKWIFSIQAKRLKAYESSVLPIMDGVLAITEEDRQRILSVIPNCNVSVVPAGVDLDQFPLLEIDISSASKKIVSLSSMDWIPNQQGVIWFLDEVLPILLRSHPNLVFVVAGRGTPDWMYKYHSKNVQILGFVENAEQLISSSHVAVVPLFSGGGMRVKILNYLAWGIPVVSTQIGAEGISLKESAIKIADTPEIFAEAILRLLADSDEWEIQRAIGYDEISQKFSWSAVVSKSLDFCKSFTSKKTHENV